MFLFSRLRPCAALGARAAVNHFASSAATASAATATASAAAGSAAAAGSSVWAGNLAQGTTPDALRQVFAAYNPTACEVVMPEKKRTNRGGPRSGYGLVQFGSEGDAAAAVRALDGTAEIGGREIVVRRDKGARCTVCGEHRHGVPCAAAGGSGSCARDAGLAPGVADFVARFAATRRRVRSLANTEQFRADRIARDPTPRRFPVDEGWRSPMSVRYSKPKGRHSGKGLGRTDGELLAGDANAMSRALNKSVQRAGLRQELARQRHFQKPTKLKFMANKNKHYFRMKRELNAILRTMEKRPQSRARVRRRQPDDAARQKAAFTPYRRPKAV